MGLFSSKTVITVGTAVTPMLGEKPNLIRQAILEAHFNKVPYTPVIVQRIFDGYGIDHEAFYRKGLNRDYFLGLPSGHIPTESNETDDITALLASKHGVSIEDITLSTITLNRAPTSFIAHYHIYNKYAYDSNTGYITEQIDPSLPANYEYELLGWNSYSSISPYDPYWGYDAMEGGIVLTFEAFDPNDRENTVTTVETSDSYYQTISVPEEINDWGYEVWYVTYQVAGEGMTRYWGYDPTIGTYPEITTYEVGTEISPYYPIVPIRINKEMVTENHPESLYADNVDSIDDILSTLNLDRVMIQDSLAENPDIGYIDDNYITFALPIGYMHDVENLYKKKTPTYKYLFRWFKDLFEKVQTVDKTTFDAAIASNPNGVPPYNVLRVRDSELNTLIHWNYITLENETYIYQDSAPYTMEYTIVPDTKETTDDNFYSKSYLVFKFRDDDNQVAWKLTVHGLYHVSFTYPGKSVVVTLNDAFNEDEDERVDGLFLPVSYKIVKTLSSSEEQEVLFNALSIISYTLVKTKVKWYQRKVFANFLKIVFIVVGVISLQPELAAFSTLTEAALFIVKAIVISLATQYAFSYIFKTLVDLVGADIAFYLAIALSVVTVGSTFRQFKFLPDAQMLVQMTTSLTGEINKDIAESYARIVAKTNELDDAISEVQREIDVALESLSEIGLNVDVLVDSLLYAETPEAFYTRTLGIDNGLRAIDISNYYDNVLSLELPTKF